jgi:hypothetical protein
VIAAGRWFSTDTPVSSTNKTYHHDISEIELQVALSTITADIISGENWLVMFLFSV